MAKHGKHKPKHPVNFKRKMIRLVVTLFVWLGIAVVYYAVFSFFLDTPVEYEMKQSLVQLETEYTQLSQRYDTLERVLENIAERDKNIFRTLYDSDPLHYDDEDKRIRQLDTLTGMTNQQLADRFFHRLDDFEDKVLVMQEELDMLQNRVLARGDEMNHIPSIQPVIDPHFTHIATSFGMRVHPFFRTMAMHNGMDYAIPEGSRVFATADGTVVRQKGELSNTGVTLVVDHGNGYETSYQHLSRTMVREGAQVKRGDIIALTGNTGLSLAPHLHYEIRLNGVQIDPVHYFFYELGPEQYERAKRQASVGMQSLD